MADADVASELLCQDGCRKEQYGNDQEKKLFHR
jgi:hypothetical protein